MKSKLIIAIALLASLTAVAQQGINYKALIKDNGGNVVANQNITVQFTILQGAVSVYQETHNSTTDANGIVIVNIGEGTLDSGVYNTINWESDDHFLNVQIDTGSGLTDMGTTQFMAVPYALSAANVSGLEALDEGNGIGWRFIGRNEANYGNIGLNAADFSYSDFVSNIYGATGNYSTSMGYLTTASGERSTAVGSVTTASAANSAAMGYGTLADDFNSLVVGTFNENSTSSTTLFQVGNGTDINDRSNAFVVEREGMIIAPSLDITEITNPKALITKEYLDANTSEASGLEAIDEGNGGSGWRFIGRDSNNYGNIGSNAVDLSISEFASEVYGATGNRSFASGYNTTASGQSSTSMGYFSVASGTRSTALGRSTIASGESSTALGTSTEANNTYSTAMGRQTLASGENATSMGYLSTASGDFSTAIGINASASGDNSIALGDTSSAIGYRSFAVGYSSIAEGQSSVAIGESASSIGVSSVALGKGAQANGDYSLSTGYFTNAGGVNSAAFGINTSASGASSFVFGALSAASGTNAFAGGYESLASGTYSIAMGYQSEANQTYAVAMGESTTSSGISSVAMGAETTASGNGSFAMGDSNIASGNTSVALGIITKASGDYSLAMGNNVQVSSFAASALGYNLINDDSYATVVGQNNDNTTTSSALFQVGNGVSTANRTNAFTVFRNGNATLAGTLTQSSDRRLKTNISELPYGLKEILQLKPVNYHWKRYPEQQKSLGLIAQEVQPIINEIVHIAEDKDNTLSISYTELIPVLIKAIQEQQAIIESQKQTIKNQEQASTEQSALLQVLLNRVEVLEKQATPSDIKLVKN